MDQRRAGMMASIEGNLAHQARAFASCSPQIRVRDEEGLLALESNIPHSYVNRVVWARLVESVADERVQEIVDGYRSRQVPVSWMIGPSSAPKDLGDRLLRAGLRRERDEVGMAMDLSSLPQGVALPPGLVVHPVADREGLGRWVGIVRASFGLPDFLSSVLQDVLVSGLGSEVSPWRLFLGVLDGEPVGASRLFLHADGAGVYHVGTLPWARGRGMGSAMTWAALREAGRLGYSLAVLRAETSAQGLYQRLGFEEYFRFHWYLWSSQGQHQTQK